VQWSVNEVITPLNNNFVRHRSIVIKYRESFSPKRLYGQTVITWMETEPRRYVRSQNPANLDDGESFYNNGWTKAEGTIAQ
jgi:hypothetical protein